MYYESENYDYEDDEVSDPFLDTFHDGLREYYAEHLMGLFDDRYWHQLNNQEKDDITLEYSEHLQNEIEEKERRTNPEKFYMTARTR